VKKKKKKKKKIDPVGNSGPKAQYGDELLVFLFFFF
jgi:hypothetical protein